MSYLVQFDNDDTQDPDEYQHVENALMDCHGPLADAMKERGGTSMVIRVFDENNEEVTSVGITKI